MNMNTTKLIIMSLLGAKAFTKGTEVIKFGNVSTVSIVLKIKSLTSDPGFFLSSLSRSPADRCTCPKFSTILSTSQMIESVVKGRKKKRLDVREPLFKPVERTKRSP